ncbi:hypothetical protein D3C83_152620 [compost metagenome]
MLFCASTALTLNMLKRSMFAWMRRLPGRRNSFERRKSIWFMRSLYIVPGSTSCTDTVPFAPLARLRPSDGSTSALV